MGKETKFSKFNIHTQLFEAECENEALISQGIVLGDHYASVREALHDGVGAKARRQQVLKFWVTLRLIAIVSSVASETHPKEVVG